eukprot:TRINITY_DN10957_c0_g1_i1.p2 TRINITY_DN10957_c0_g1~~TRINITY_DN10957_c0_g1_i1.p2  ORF type:complete len:215 (-),score=62.50 TRINITY_DN10957_c0_g1_i1:203-847(-)
MRRHGASRQKKGQKVDEEREFQQYFARVREIRAKNKLEDKSRRLPELLSSTRTPFLESYDIARRTQSRWLGSSHSETSLLTKLQQERRQPAKYEYQVASQADRRIRDDEISRFGREVKTVLKIDDQIDLRPGAYYSTISKRPPKPAASPSESQPEDPEDKWAKMWAKEPSESSESEAETVDEFAGKPLQPTLDKVDAWLAKHMSPGAVLQYLQP